MTSVVPSLNALRAFEVTARRRSMTLAAEELCVTHGAVSRQIKSLEAALGMALLTRGARSIKPTPEGLRLAEGLRAAFSLVEATIEHVRPSPLVLSCSSSIAMCWLIPRISGFYERNPDIEINLDLNYDKTSALPFGSARSSRRPTRSSAAWAQSGLALSAPLST